MDAVHNDNGGYKPEDIIWHQHSSRLMKAILEIWTKDITIKDLGCGHNYYAGVLNTLGYNAIGFDLIDINKSEYFIKADLCLDSIYSFQKTNIISLEVGEHIPYNYCFSYLDNIKNAACGGDIILSWAVPGQLGIGHINCQTNQWVIDQMKQRGYELNHDKTIFLRDNVIDCHCDWFRNTLMYFNL